MSTPALILTIYNTLTLSTIRLHSFNIITIYLHYRNLDTDHINKAKEETNPMMLSWKNDYQ